VLASVGSVGDAYDNALAESFVDSFKTELIADRVWRTRAQLELAIVEYLGWFNDSRLHQALGDLPPSEFERLSQTRTLEIALSGKEGTNKPGLRGTQPGSTGSQPIVQNGLPTAFSQETPVPDRPTVRTGPDRASRARILMPRDAGVRLTPA
jgi:Integrase core domain